MAETNFRDDEADRPGSGLEITLRRAAITDWQPQDRSRQATGSSGCTGSVTSSIVAQQHADNDAFNSSWDPYQYSAIASIPEPILKQQPYTIRLLELIASNAEQAHRMHEKIADLEQQLSAANKALAELKPAHDDRTLPTAGHGDYFSKSQQQWVPLSDEFKLQIMWHETTAQKKFDVHETLNLPLQKCIFTEDGTPIADHVYRSMRTDAKELILLQLAGLPDQPMATKYRMLAFYKARYAPQLSKVCRTLSERWCELAMCANVWKARAMIGRALRAIGQVSVTDFRVADEAESSSTPSGGRSRLSSTWTTPMSVPSSPTKAPTSSSTSKITIRARAVADAFGSNANPPLETTTSAQPTSTPSTNPNPPPESTSAQPTSTPATNPNPPPESTTSAQPPSTSSTAVASTSTLALTDRSNLSANAASIPTPALTLSGSQAPTDATTSLSTSEVEAIDKNVAIALLDERNVTTNARQHARTITKLLVKSHVAQPIRQEDLRTATAAVSSAASKRRKGNT